MEDKDLKDKLNNLENGFDLEFETTLLQDSLIERFLRVMEQKNISEKQLAKDIGISQSYICDVFNSNKLLNLKTIVKILHYLNIVFLVDTMDKDEHKKTL